MNRLHAWNLMVAGARETQLCLAATESRDGVITDPRFIVGVNVSVSREGRLASGAVIVLEYPSLTSVEVKVIGGELAFPYVSGLLSFREARHIPVADEALASTADGEAVPAR